LQTCDLKKGETMRSVPAITPVILAAGDSTRMGYPKALLPLGNEVFLTHILKILQVAGMAKPRLILGRTADRIKPLIRQWPVDIIINSDPDRGQLSSIQLGMSALAPEFNAVMIWPVDQPSVSVDLVRSLTQLFIDSEALMVFPLCGNKRGHPALFHRSLFQEFMDAPLEEGPKSILQKYQYASATISTEETSSILDIDTPAEYQTLTGKSLDSILKSAEVSRTD
jgi:molybdenum cofactor cytidylyltransferase